MSGTGNGDAPNAAPLSEAANKLRGSVEAAEYKHLVLGLLFLRYISDSFGYRRARLEAEACDPSSENYVENPDEIAEILEDRDEYLGQNVFWVPESARWESLLAAASQPAVAKRIDDALAAIEQENTNLRNVLPRIYARAPLSAELMGSLVETIAKIGFGTDPETARDVLGRTYEYATGFTGLMNAYLNGPRPLVSVTDAYWLRDGHLNRLLGTAVGPHAGPS